MVDHVPIHHLLPDRLESLAAEARERLCQDEQTRGMKLAWDFVGEQLGDALKSVLGGDLLDLLAAAWAEAPELAALADLAIHPPGERSLIELGAHDFSHRLNPVVAVTLASCPCVELHFALDIAAHVGGVRLAVADGHIIGGDLGELWGSAQLSCEGQPLHPPSETRRLAVPASFRFDPPGIAIPRLN